MVVRPGCQGKKQVARLSDAAVPPAGQAALEEHRAVTSSRGGRENSARHKDFRGGSGPTSCLLAMKRHGPFSSPSHVRDHEPFFYSLGSCAYPSLDTPNRDAVRLWTALGPGLCRVAATRHQVCAVGVRNNAALGFGGSEAQGIVSRRGRADGQTGSSGTRPPPAAMASANRDAALTGDWQQQHSLNLA